VAAAVRPDGGGGPGGPRPFFLHFRRAGCLGVGLGAAALGVWALSANRPATSTSGDAQGGAQFVQTGPYRLDPPPDVHPASCWAALALYGVEVRIGRRWASAVLARWRRWCGSRPGWRSAGWSQQHPGYADYIKTTRRFIPWLV